MNCLNCGDPTFSRTEAYCSDCLEIEHCGEESL